MKFDNHIVHTITEYHILTTVSDIGLRLLGIVLLFLIIQELVNLIGRGQADFVSPLVKVAFAAILIGNIGYLGKILADAAHGISAEIYPPARDMNAFFEFLVSHDDEAKTWDRFFNVSVTHVIATGLTFAMMIVKVLVIDILWQVLFSFSVLLGALSIPLSLLFGSLKSWARSMIEYTLWPIVFSVFMLTMNESIRGIEPPDGQDSIERDMSRILIAGAVIVLSTLTPLVAKALVESELGKEMTALVSNQVYIYSEVLYQKWPTQVAVSVTRAPGWLSNEHYDQTEKQHTPNTDEDFEGTPELEGSQKATEPSQVSISSDGIEPVAMVVSSGQFWEEDKRSGDLSLEWSVDGTEGFEVLSQDDVNDDRVEFSAKVLSEPPPVPDESDETNAAIIPGLDDPVRRTGPSQIKSVVYGDDSEG